MGSSYEHGAVVSPRHCTECVCRDGSMQCRPLNPATHCPPLPCPATEQFTVPGECCKQCPGMNRCSKFILLHIHLRNRRHTADVKQKHSPGFITNTQTFIIFIFRAPIDSVRPSVPNKQKHLAILCCCHLTCQPFTNGFILGLKNKKPSTTTTHKKGVDYCAAGHDCHQGRAQCINLLTTYACQCLPGYSGDGKRCTGTYNLNSSFYFNPIIIIFLFFIFHQLPN